MKEECRIGYAQQASPLFFILRSAFRISKRGWSLTELLCVMAIISILAGLYLGVIAKAFIRVKKFLDGM